MRYALALLDKAKQVYRSDNRTAEAAGVKRQTLHSIRSGKAKLSPELAAIIAASIGDDPDYAAKRVMIENAAPDLQARLHKAFRVAAGVVGAVGVAVAMNGNGPAHAGEIKKAREQVDCQTVVDTLHIVLS